MKKIASLIMAVAFASAAYAGPVSYSAKGGKEVAPPLPPAGCESFAPGFAFGVYGGAFLPDSSAEDDELGGGVVFDYFFTEYVGVQGTYGIYATEQEHHEFNGALVLRYPIKSICLAPYVMAGGGFSVNSDDRGNYFVGGGLEYRIESANSLGIFADGAYHFAEDSNDVDYTIVRLGVKFPF